MKVEKPKGREGEVGGWMVDCVCVDLGRKRRTFRLPMQFLAMSDFTPLRH